MSSPDLTDFQQAAEEEVIRALAAHGRAAPMRELLTGVVPFYSTAPQTVVKLSSGDVTVWVFDSEISYTIGPRTGGLEREDYASEHQLLADFVHQFGSFLAA